MKGVAAGRFPMVQLLLTALLRIFESLYVLSTSNSELALLAGSLAYLLIRGKMKSALILLFGVALCFANYFIFQEYSYLTIPLIYSVGFGGVSIFLLLLLVYQFLHSS
jgi:hypothetical protein